MNLNRKKMARMKTIGIMVLATLTLLACRKNVEKPSWDVGLVAPVVYSSMGLDDIIADSLLQVNPDSSLTLVYDNNIYTFSLDTLTEIPDTTLENYYSLNFGTIIPAGQLLVPGLIEDTKYDLNGAALTEAIIKSGTVTFELRSTIQEWTIYDYAIPSATDAQGDTFKIQVMVPPGTTQNPSVVVNNYDMAGYHFDLRGSTQNDFNTLQTQLTVRTDPNGNDVAITSADSVSVVNSFIDILPYFAKGYFGNESDVVVDQSSFSFANNIVGGSIDIDQLDLTLELINTIGAEASVNIQNLASVNTSNASAVSLSHNIIGNDQFINRAVNLGNGNVTPSIFTVQLDELNSNADAFLENIPDALSYDIDLQINPFGNTAQYNDFIYCDGSLEANLNLELPLCLIANDLTLADTVSFDVNDYLEEDDNGELPHPIKDGTFKIFAENGFPIEAELQLYMLDGNGVIIDSIVTDNTIPSGVVDGNLRVIEKSSSIVLMPLSEAQVNMLYNITQLKLVVKFNTASLSQHVKLYDHYTIDLKLVGDFNYTVELN